MEQMTSIDALRLEVAREKGVPPEVLAPLFEKLGLMGLTPDQMREKAAEAIKAILARANEKIEPSKDGADIDKAIAASRAKLAGLDTAGAAGNPRQEDRSGRSGATKAARYRSWQRRQLSHG